MMAIWGACLNFAFVTMFVTSAWVFLSRNLTFGTLSLAMYFPTVFAVLFKVSSGEVTGFLAQTVGVQLPADDAPFDSTARTFNIGSEFGVATACLISVALVAVSIALCAFLDLLLGWGHLAKRDEDKRPSDVKSLMSRHEIWGFLRVSGEEVGWRCFLLPCLMETYSPVKAFAVSGVIWGLFHVAIMIILTHRLKVDRPVTTVLVQCASVFLIAYPHNWIAMRSGYSLWPSAVMHFTWNILNPWALGSIYTQKPGLIAGNQWLINGEGLAGCIVATPIAILIMKDLAG